MPFDSFPERRFKRNEPKRAICACCHLPINADAPAEHLKFDADYGYRLDQMEGHYHADCAKPYLSMLRALESLKPAPF